MKPTRFELTQEQFDKVLGVKGRVAMERLNKGVADIGRQIAQDQIAWVDRCMKDLLPPDIYADAHALRNMEAVAAYYRKTGIRLIHIPDRCGLRIEVLGKPYGEWMPTFTVDGEPVSFEKGKNSLT